MVIRFAASAILPDSRVESMLMQIMKVSGNKIAPFIII